MEAASPARFRPTWRQSVGRGLYVGALVSVLTLTAALAASLVNEPAGWVWMLLTAGPPLAGLAGGLLPLRFGGAEITARGIRTAANDVQSWEHVVDLRAERRGARTVVSVYLDSGRSVQLAAPYSGGLFAADPQFESKVFALAHLWRSHRFGGLPS